MQVLWWAVIKKENVLFGTTVILLHAFVERVQISVRYLDTMLIGRGNLIFHKFKLACAIITKQC